MKVQVFKIIISTYDSSHNEIEIAIKTTNNKSRHDIERTILTSLKEKGLIEGGCSVSVDWDEFNQDEKQAI